MLLLVRNFEIISWLHTHTIAIEQWQYKECKQKLYATDMCTLFDVIHITLLNGHACIVCWPDQRIQIAFIYSHACCLIIFLQPNLFIYLNFHTGTCLCFFNYMHMNIHQSRSKKLHCINILLWRYLPHHLHYVYHNMKCYYKYTPWCSTRIYTCIKYVTPYSG